MPIEKDCVDRLYEQREKLIIIGLTGRTGAGCTTVANILSKDNLSDMDLHSPKTRDFRNSDERKYSIIRKYMNNERWKAFTIIEASTIIFSFFANESLENFFEYLDGYKGEISDKDKLKKELCKFALNKDNLNINDIEVDEFLDKHKNIKLVPEIEHFYFNEMKEEENPDRLLEIISFYTKKLKDRKNTFKKITEKCMYTNNEKEFNLYSFLLQEIGNNIRSSGNPFDDNFEPGNEMRVAERINELVKIINLYEERKDKKEIKERKRTRICIDAFRNPLEIQYFRDRYRSFYVFAVNTEDSDRKNRLGLKRSQMDSLDEIEYPQKHKENYDIFYHQDIQACLEIADVYLYNPDVTNQHYYMLTEQLLKYIALMLQPGLVTPTHLERCMQLAFNAKYNSGCISRQVGAVVTGEDFSIRSVGWNDVPKGQVPCNLRCVEDYCRNKDEETFSEFELTEPMFEKVMKNIDAEYQKDEVCRDKPFVYCFKSIYNGMKKDKNQVHTRALHAEENAFLQIAKYGGAKIEGGKLFTTASPCELCSKKAYQLGIKEIYYIDPYPGISKSHILKFGKHNNPKMILFSGAIGNAYISLYSPRMPYKDEMELYTGIDAKKIAENTVSDIKNKK